MLPLIAVLLAGCSSSKPMKLPWNTRAQEQSRMNAATSPHAGRSETDLLKHDPKKEFPLAQANTTGARSYPTGKAGTGEFQFMDRVRTKNYSTGAFATKNAWMGDYRYETKSAPVRESWFARLTSRTKTYETREARDTGKTAPTKALPDGDRPFLAQGRRQADFDRNGPASQIPKQSWEGDLKPLTIEDVKKLLNKN